MYALVIDMHPVLMSSEEAEVLISLGLVSVGVGSRTLHLTPQDPQGTDTLSLLDLYVPLRSAA